MLFLLWYKSYKLVIKLKGKVNPQNKKKACSETCKFLISTPETTKNWLNFKKRLKFGSTDFSGESTGDLHCWLSFSKDKPEKLMPSEDTHDSKWPFFSNLVFDDAGK